MRIDVISLFPEWVAQLRDYGVVGRGIRGRGPGRRASGRGGRVDADARQRAACA